MRIKVKLLIIIFFLSTVFSVDAQNNQVSFTNYTIDDGLSLSSIYCILEDSKGFMWFGTEDGLNRFDGSTFEIFRPNANKPNYISNKWIDNIFEDNLGYLWVFTQGGLNKYNQKTKKFQVYKYNESNKKSISSDLTTCIFQDSENNIWIGTQNGVNLYNKKTNEFKRYFYNNNYKSFVTSISETKNKIWIGTKKGLLAINKIDFSIKSNKNNFHSDEIHNIYSDNNNLWLSTNNGLIIFNVKTNKTKRYLHSNNNINTISDNNVRSVFKDSENNYWISTKAGFDIFDIEKQKFKLLIKTEGQSLSLSSNKNRPIFEDNLKTIWFGTYGNGLFSYNLKTKKINNYVHNSNDNTSISENTINSIIQDKSNVVWFGTFGAGLNTYAPYKQKFNLIKKQPSNSNTLSSNFVWSIHEDNSGLVWIGTNDTGVDKYNPKTETFKNYRNQKNKNSLSNNCVREIFQDSKQNLWFGTNGGGLNKFNIETEKFTIYKHNPKDTNSLSDNSVRVIFEDKDNFLWIGTQNGLNKFNHKTKIFKQYLLNPNDTNSLSHNFIYSGIYQDKEGFLWIGTYGGGLNKFDIENEIFTRYTHNNDNPKSISSDIVFNIQEDEKGNLWIATNGGLEYFDKKNETFTHYTTENGLANNVIYSVLKVKSNLWMSTNYGISNYNIKNREFQNYVKSDGLQSIEFNGGAFHKGKTGTLYFAGVNGLNYFNPENIILNQTPPTTIIKKISIFNKEIKIDNNISGNEIVKRENNYFMSKDIVFTDEIVLTYNEKVFSIELSALHYSNHKENAYSYRLRNFEENWNNTKNRNFVTYTSIPHGTYFFEYKSANSDGIWSDIKTLKVIITPPIWKTTWFYLTAVLLAIFLIILFIKLREKKHIKEKKFLEKKVKERTIEINLNNIEIEAKNEELNQTNEELQTILDTINQQNEEITQQRDNIENQKNELEKLSIVADKTDNAVIIADKFGEIEWVNEGFTRLLGVTLEEFKKNYGSSIYKISLNPQIEETIHKSVFMKKSVVYTTNTFKKDGKQLWIQTTLTPIFDTNNRLNKFIAIDSDITKIKKAESEIIKHRDELHIKNKQITDSISYAQRIQSAILPSEKILQKNIADYFVLFKPRDVVSGDFYWWTEINDHTIITAADCTGHGVPGALMSMLGVTFLQEIVSKDAITSPELILNRLRQEIINALKQKGQKDGQKDGMDMAIISINNKTNVLQYSGAYNPLFIIRNDELKILPANKMPVSIFLKMKDFTMQEIQLQKNDKLYMFSDGYSDQFGGMHRKKFLIKNFKKLLLQISNKNMAEQKELLNNNLVKWMNNEEQVDDIVVIGIKI